MSTLHSPRPAQSARPPTFSGQRGLIATASLAYVASTGLGVVMRAELLGWHTGIPFDHLLHAHSHTLYFGWAGLGVLIMAAGAFGDDSPAPRRTMLFLALSIPAIFVGFLTLGYHPVTIAISTVVMFAWYLAIWLWWRKVRRAEGVGFTLLKAAFTYLVASSVGVWVLGVLQATGSGGELSENLAVHAFLLGFAWFLVLGVIGLVTIYKHSLGLYLDEEVLRRALWWWAPMAIITFPLGVSGGPEVVWLGPAARLAGLALLYPAWLWVRTLWQGSPHGAPGRPWRLASIWFALAAAGVSAVAAGGTPVLDWVGRQGVVLYLHVLLVGFITSGLFALISKSSPSGILDSHHLMLGVMVVGLAMASGGFYRPGMWVAAAGGAGLWLVGLAWALLLLRRLPRRAVLGSSDDVIEKSGHVPTPRQAGTG